MNTNYFKKAFVVILVVIGLGAIVLQLNKQQIFTNKKQQGEYVEEVIKRLPAEERFKAEQKEFKDLYYAALDESVSNLGVTDDITAYDPETVESFADGRLKGNWKRSVVRLSSADHKNEFGDVRGVRTRKSIYDPEENSLFVMSMTGEIFYAQNLTVYSGLEITNPKVVIEPNSFCGLNKENGDYVIIGAIKYAHNSGDMYYSTNKGETWKKSTGSWFKKIHWAATTETGQILMVCENNKGIVIKRSTDYGVTYSDLTNVPDKYSAVKAVRIFNTSDRCDILVQHKDDNTYRYFIYENGNLITQPNLPNLKIKNWLYGAKVGEDIIFSFFFFFTPFKLPIYNENWEQIDSIMTSANHGAQGIIFPLGEYKILSRWPAPKYWDKEQGQWVNFNSANIGYDAHSIQFFKRKDGQTLMVNNCDNGLRVKVINNFNDVLDDTNPFIRLQNYHRYAELHGGDAHPDGHVVAAYQDQGTELLVKQVDGTYSAVKMGGPDGLETTISKEGTGVWYRHYWQQCWFHKITNGTKGKKYTVNLDLGAKWRTPRMSLTYIPGEESVYMGGDLDSMVIKLTYNPGKDKVELTKLPYKFPAVVSTVVAAEANPDKMYLTTKKGRFYFSNDRGVSWTESQHTVNKAFKPSNQIWGGSAGEAIEVPKDKPNWVYFSNNHGSNVNGKCMLSTDGGNTFTNIAAGLESASRVRDMAVSADGEMVFSTTYHVYYKSQEEWFPIKGDNFISSGLNAKNVVYLEEQNLVRYFTASAGMVDFVIDNSSSHIVKKEESIKIDVYPNPVVNDLNIKWDENIAAAQIIISDMQGKEVLSASIKNEGQTSAINVSELKNGVYIISVKTNKGMIGERFIVHR